jgi:hypothetical protein
MTRSRTALRSEEMNILRSLLRRRPRQPLARPASATALDHRTSPATKAAIANLVLNLQARLKDPGQPLPPLRDSGFRVFSQFDEDGYLLYLATVLELEPRIFLDIGAFDGINSNCANLALNLGWHGLFLEADSAKVERGRAFYASHPDTSLYPPVFKQVFITAENINEIIRSAGFSGDIGICSIDIDGNDCWVWKALEVVRRQWSSSKRILSLACATSRCLTIRTSDCPASTPSITAPLRWQWTVWPGKKDYRLVGANRYGFNMIFVRNDVFPDRVPAVPLESIMRHPRYADRLSLVEPIKDWAYVAL